MRAGYDGVVSESSESIAKACRLTRTTVIRVLAQLVEMNLIQCDRNIGKKTSFHLQSPDSWQHLKQREKKSIPKQQSKVVQLISNQTCTPGIHVQEINTLPVSELNTLQESTHHPPIGGGGVVDSPAVNEIHTPPVNETDTSEPVNEIHTSLDGKLTAARNRGWRDTGTWWNDCGIQMVTVNRFVVSVTEFMGRSLDSFDVGRQVCESGLRMCREQIERIKRRKAFSGTIESHP